MSEELLQRDLLRNPDKIGLWDFYNIGSTTINALKQHRIIRSVDYGSIGGKKVDGLVVQKKNVIAIIEYKKPSEFKTKRQQNKAVKQEIEVARILGARIFVATDTKDTIWINPLTGNRICGEDGEEIREPFEPKNESTAKLMRQMMDCIGEKSDALLPRKFVNPTDLAKQIWQDIWSVSGATPENCLYTFVELFIFKYLSDLNVLTGLYSFKSLVDGFSSNTDEDILENYASVIRPKIKMLFPENPTDKTTIINGTIFVSKDQKAVKGYSSVFKKVLEKFNVYGKLEHIDCDFKSQLFESFLKESISKKNWGQYFTPLRVVRAIVEMARAEIKPGVAICDPACGVGKFLLEPIAPRLGELYEIRKNKITPKLVIRGFDKGFDAEEQKTIILAKANMLIYFSELIKENPNLTEAFSNLFNDSFTLKTNSILGTLSEPVEEEFDLILTNPPYVMSGSSNLKEEIKKDGELVNYYKINALGVEGLFLEWIVRALKPNGKAFIVIPDGILNRQNDKHLRKFILDECYLDGIISLPVKTFFTTQKKTYILCVTKKADKSDSQKDPVFTYLVSEIGESRDVYRFDIDQDDLQEAVTLYSFFQANKRKFSKINTDERCKIVPIKTFQPNEHWSVDRWWTMEEKIALGIVEDEQAIGMDEFGDLLKGVSESLGDISALLKEAGSKDSAKKRFEEISLDDEEYFELSIGKRILKREMRKIREGIPVYSANVQTPIGLYTRSNLKDFGNNFVLWGIDGDFEFSFIPKNTPFVPTDHCGVIRIKNDRILPEYLMQQLKNVKHKYGFDRGLRASLRNMKKVSIKIPLDNKGKIDTKQQQAMIDKYRIVEEARNLIEQHRQKVNEVSVEL